MIWRSLISFSLLSTLACAASEISGKVVLRDSTSGATQKEQDFSGVVISLLRSDAPSPSQAPNGATMDQKHKTFVPHVLAVQVGATVDFPNNDPIFHNAFSSYSGQIFDVGLYPPGKNRAVKFSRPGVVRVFCNIHPSMSAIIVVLDTPYFAVTKKSGEFSINAPAGTYDLHVFHERASESTLRNLSRTIQVGPEPLRLPVITVSEAGFLPSQHLNKYGRPYPPVTDDRGVYTGVNK